MQQRHIFLVIGISLILVAAILFIGKNRDTSSPAPAQISTNLKVSPSNKFNTQDLNAVTSPATPSASKPNTKALSREAMLEEINAASVTYDAKALPRIQPYLINPDPEIREAAKNGMIVLGDAAAGPLLRDASKKMATPQEAVGLLEAADYVELPSGLTLLNKKSSAGKNHTLGGAKKALVPKEGEVPSAPMTR